MLSGKASLSEARGLEPELQEDRGGGGGEPQGGKEGGRQAGREETGGHSGSLAGFRAAGLRSDELTLLPCANASRRGPSRSERARKRLPGPLVGR